MWIKRIDYIHERRKFQKFCQTQWENLSIKIPLLSQKKRRTDLPLISHLRNSYLSAHFLKWKAAHEVCPHHLGAPDHTVCYQTTQTAAGSKLGSLSQRRIPPGLSHMRQ